MSTRSTRWAIISAVVVAAGAVMLYHFDPAAVHIFPPCLFHALTGWNCPGCGATRAVHHLLHGDVAGAFRLNPLLFVAAPFFVLTRLRPRIVYIPAVAWTTVAVTVVYGIVRNLPFWPYPL